MSKINYVLLLLIINISFINAQQSFYGEVIYEGQRKGDVKTDSSSLSSFPPNSPQNALLSVLREKLKSGIQQTYILKFDKTSSLYKKVDRLEAPNSDGISFSTEIGFSGNVIYKNLKKNRYTLENEIYGKVFLIKDELEKHNWKLENEIKKIGNYTCYKATKIIKKKVRANKYAGFSLSKNKTKDPIKPEMKEIEVVVTAWYTPQIPVTSGPGVYHGLPGLILEVVNGNQIIICSSIKINTKKKTTIKEPKRGEEVNQAEFDKILKDKREERKSRSK